jgi:hypothetical protein
MLFKTSHLKYSPRHKIIFIYIYFENISTLSLLNINQMIILKTILIFKGYKMDSRETYRITRKKSSNFSDDNTLTKLPFHP